MATGQEPQNPDPQAAKAAAETRKAEAEARKAEADAEKAASDAEKAAAEAALAALKAKIGGVPDSGISGDVTLKDKAGSAEATLLAAKAVNAAAQRITDELPQGPKTILLYAAGEIPSFQELIAFRSQVALTRGAFNNAVVKSDDVKAKAPKPIGVTGGETPFLPAAGLALEAISKLVGFFRSDFTVGGVDVSQDDSLLVHALAGRIASSGKQLTVQLLGTYNPGSVLDPAAGILKDLSDLSGLKVKAINIASFHDQMTAHFTKTAEAEKDPAKKRNLQENASLHKEAGDTLRAAVALYDGFLSKLTATNDKGLVPLTQVVRDSVVADSLAKGALLLIVKLQKSGGTFYTKKNLWTFFGGMPIFHMGGVVVSFVLLDGKDGHVLGSGAVPVHGGFVRAGQLQSVVEN
ncbi:MAG TPA: hypothetical protein DD490_06130 [Acidobacteria bacterium]|nr:hypothetical protein [Acidobacteriota bacterium]